ncbi:MAG: PAS domain-containing sensor histidine kinase, partial [Terriglobales bacterium]
DDSRELVGTGDVVDLMRAGVHVQHLLKEVSDVGNKVIETQIKRNEKQQQRAAEVQSQVDLIIRVGLAMSAFIATALALYFNRGTSRRLHVLMQNTLNLAMDKELQAPVKGSDEIAVLDRTIHEVAALLAESRHKEQALTENVAEVICSLDQNGRFTKVNQAVEKSWGYTVDELPGQQIYNLIQPNTSANVRKTIEDAVNDRGNGSFETSLRKKDQSYCDTQWSVQWSQGEKSLFCVAHDISERKRLERMKQEVVAMVSHDLRSPLTAMQVMLDLFEAGALGELNERGEQKITQGRKTVDRLVGLVNDLLDIEKLESGMFELSYSSGSAKDMVLYALESVQTSAEHKKIEVRLADCDVDVWCDRDRVVRVIANLLDNAIKYSPSGETVTVSCVQQGDQVQFNFADRGRGVPSDKVETIFERFKQSDPGDEIEKRGSGLGLAICKAIVEAHGGQIAVESEPGSGSRFWFHLPQESGS